MFFARMNVFFCKHHQLELFLVKGFWWYWMMVFWLKTIWVPLWYHYFREKSRNDGNDVHTFRFERGFLSGNMKLDQPQNKKELKIEICRYAKCFYVVEFCLQFHECWTWGKRKITWAQPLITGSMIFSDYRMRMEQRRDHISFEIQVQFVLWRQLWRVWTLKPKDNQNLSSFSPFSHRTIPKDD